MTPEFWGFGGLAPSPRAWPRREAIVARLRTPRHAPLPLLTALLVAASASGCGERAAEEPAKRSSVPVTVAKAEQSRVPVEVQAIGAVEPLQTVAVRAQVEGILQEVLFQEGDEVRVGQVLFRLDPRPFQAALQQAEANLRQAEVQAKNAQAEARRYEVLVRKDYVTREQYDQMRTQAEAKTAGAAAARAAVENARVQLGYATITSPLAGKTGSLQVKVGDVVQANASTPLVVINEIQPILVAFSVPEQHLADIQKYRKAGPLSVRVRSADTANPAQEGKLVFVDNTVNQSTGTVLLKARFDNRDSGLWPGEFVEVDLVLYVREHAVVVPTQAVQTGQQGDYVFVVRPDRTVALRQVTAGPAIWEKR